MTPVMPQIEKIVFLMLENRSLDNVLGWLYDGQELSPDRVFPAGSPLQFAGASQDDYNYVGTTGYAPNLGTQNLPSPMRQPRWNPNEWWHNIGNQMYWDAYGHDAVPRWSPTHTPPMTGFAVDYAKDYDSSGEVMGAYSRDQLPVLYGLAENYAVSDRWFSSIPTETNPNRAFSVCGSSQGALNNADTTYFTLPTIFNRLSEAPAPKKTWGIYWQYKGIFGMDPNWFHKKCFTADIFTQIGPLLDAKRGKLGTRDEFFDALKSDDLPDFSYLEPFWGGGYGWPNGEDFFGLQGNDYHPPQWVGQGEWDLNELYNALRNSQYWENMLFIITFDEHGGTWDHVPPTKTVPPDKIKSDPPFAFDRLGPRVPTILVSPYIRPGTVFRSPDKVFDFDHTSFIATILGWAGIDPKQANLGTRVAIAPTFEGVLATTRYPDPPAIVVPAEYRHQGGPKGPHNLPFPVDGLDIRTFRALMHESRNEKDFIERLRAFEVRPHDEG